MIAKLVSTEHWGAGVVKVYKALWNLYPPLEIESTKENLRLPVIALSYVSIAGSKDSFVEGRTLGGTCITISDMVKGGLVNDSVIGVMEDTLENMGYSVIDGKVPKAFTP